MAEQMAKSTLAEGVIVEIPAGPVVLDGELYVPDGATGVVIFAHGSGSSRHSPRNQEVAARLRKAGLATLLMDLLTQGEEAEDMRTRRLRFDINLLADRLVAATYYLSQREGSSHLKPGFFGASTGGGAALVASAELGERSGAVVSRGGRPDLAGDALARVSAPTLLIVGGEDHPVIDMNRAAMAQMSAQTKLEIIPGATHLFSETGALEKVADLAADWFTTHLRSS